MKDAIFAKSSGLQETKHAELDKELLENDDSPRSLNKAADHNFKRKAYLNLKMAKIESESHNEL